MSQPPTITIDEFDGTHGYVRTKGFVNYTIDLASHQPRQKVMLGDSEVGDVQLPCIVCTDDITLDDGCGYWFGGIDYVWEAGEEIQLLLNESSWVQKFHDPADE